MTKLKNRFGKWLITTGLRLCEENPETVKSTEVKLALDKPVDTVVEVEGPAEQWQPEQHGNVVIAEPELMTLHRRGKMP